MEQIFNLILHAGNSKSSAMEAIECARDGRLQDAYFKLGDAQHELTIAHRLQNKVFQTELHGTQVITDLLTVHAQDHLTAAMITLDLSEEFVRLYQLVKGIGSKEEIS